MDVKYIAYFLILISLCSLAIMFFSEHKINPVFPNNTSPVRTPTSYPNPPAPSPSGTLKYTSTTFECNEGHKI